MIKTIQEKEISSASLRNWNDGMLEYWNVGFGILGYGKFLKTVLIIPYKRNQIHLFLFTIPVFHHSIIPGWNKKNGWVEIPYYQQFVEIAIHEIS